MTVFSVEKPVKELLPLSDEQHANPEKFGAVENMRLRVIPVLGTSPAIFGQTMASYVLTQLGGDFFFEITLIFIEAALMILSPLRGSRKM